MKLLLALLVLGALLVGADRVAEQVAERALAEQLEAELGTRPTVEIAGFPLLTQALRGRYDELRVAAPRAREGAVTVEDLSATLRGAQVPLGDALGGAVDAVPVEELAATGVVTYAQLEALAGAGDLELAHDPQGVRVRGSVRVLGRTVTASAVSSVALDGDTLVVRATRLDVEGARPPAAVERALRDRLDLRLPLPPLPYDVTLREVSPGPRGITVSGTARDVVLRR